MPSKKITAMPDWAGNQVASDLLTGVDLSAAAALQNVKSTITDFFGNVPAATVINTPARTTPASGLYLAARTPADLALTADTESVGVQLGGNASLATVTRQWTAGGGAFTVQREIVAVAPTYAATSAETITQAATFSITNQPLAGANMTLTNAYAIWIQAGLSRFDGNFLNSAAARTGTAPPYFATRTPADTALTADTESVGVQLGGGLALATVTRQFTSGGGAFTQQREIVAMAPIYSATGAETITNSATFAVTNAPQAGTNMTLTNAYAIWAQAGLCQFDGNAVVNSNLWVGNGITAAAPVAGTINGTGGAGSNIAGANLEINGGKGTGNATPGIVGIRFPLVGASGSTLQSLSANLYPVSAGMFVSTANKSISNTTAETSLFPTGSGTRTIEAGMARVGQCYRINLSGDFNTTGVPTVRIRLMLGSTQITDTGALTIAVASIAGRFWYWSDLCIISIGATGQAYTSWSAWNYWTGGTTQLTNALIAGGAPTVDFTAAQQIDVLITFGTMSASNNVTTFAATINIIR